MSDHPHITLSKRDMLIICAALLTVEDAPKEFGVSCQVLRTPKPSDKEVVDLGQRILTQIDPNAVL